MHYLGVGPNKGKAAYLKKFHGATQIIGPIAPSTLAESPAQRGQVLVCVVDNLHWDAAGICHNDHEFRRFLDSRNDQRPRVWLLMDRAEVVKLNPNVAPLLT